MTIEEVLEGIPSGLTTLNQKSVRITLDVNEPTNYSNLLHDGIRQMVDGSIIPSKTLLKLLVDANLLLFKDEAISIN